MDRVILHQTRGLIVNKKESCQDCNGVIIISRSLIGTALATTVTGVSLSNMFEAAVSKFVKTCGKESLVSVPSLDEADRCRPFQVKQIIDKYWFCLGYS